MTEGDIVVSRDGLHRGKATGTSQSCWTDGCRGRRFAVKWDDKKLTRVCSKSVEWRDDLGAWKLL